MALSPNSTFSRAMPCLHPEMPQDLQQAARQTCAKALESIVQRANTRPKVEIALGLLLDTQDPELARLMRPVFLPLLLKSGPLQPRIIAWGNRPCADVGHLLVAAFETSTLPPERVLVQILRLFGSNPKEAPHGAMACVVLHLESTLPLPLDPVIALQLALIRSGENLHIPAPSLQILDRFLERAIPRDAWIEAAARSDNSLSALTAVHACGGPTQQVIKNGPSRRTKDIKIEPISSHRVLRIMEYLPPRERLADLGSVGQEMAMLAGMMQAKTELS